MTSRWAVKPGANLQANPPVSRNRFYAKTPVARTFLCEMLPAYPQFMVGHSINGLCANLREYKSMSTCPSVVISDMDD